MKFAPDGPDMARRAVFLDRDGVLNRAFLSGGVPRPPASLAELEILPGVVEACAILRDAGLMLIVATNQPDIARGTQTRAVADAINAAVVRATGAHCVFMCVHDDKDHCTCRKPKPGMLLEAAARYRLIMSGSVMVGDRDRDIAAGRTAGCRTVFINHGYGHPPTPPADLTVGGLLAAVDFILDTTKESIDA